MSVRLRTLLLVGALLASAAGAGVAWSGAASADTLICDQYGSTTVGGRYVVMNNRWGSAGPQCINVTSSGFQITQQDGQGNLSGAPASYPAIYLGCHYTNCSPGSPLPAQISGIGSASSSISYTYVSNATYDAAYDIWMDPTAKKDGVNQTEIMIWFNHTGSVQPVGSSRGTANVGGRSWTVWTGNNGSNNVVSYVAPSAIGSWSFSVLDFLNDTINRGYGTRSWYLTSIQAGFEPWVGGAGLAVNSFSASVSGGTPPPPSTTPVTTPPTTNPPPPSGGCRVTYGANNWSNGFTANVTITNSSSSAVNGWSLAFTLPGGQAITNSWNATLSGSSGSITARNVSYNGTIGANGGTQSFGFQGTYSGSFARPSSFSLNGTACSVG